jgi:hypothetical protein
MIRTAVNGEPCAVAMEGVDTVGELLEQLQVHVQPRDVIVGIRINGVGYDDDPGAKLRSLPVTGITEIDLQTRSPEAFAGEANGRLDAYLWAIRGKFRRTAESFENGSHAEAFRYYRGAVEELGLLVALCEKLGRLSTPAGTTGAGEIARDLQLICDELEATHVRRDFVALRRVLSERLLPLLDRWRSMLGVRPAVTG